MLIINNTRQESGLSSLRVPAGLADRWAQLTVLTQGLTAIHYYMFRHSEANFWLLWGPVTHVVHTHAYRQKSDICSKEFKTNTIGRKNVTHLQSSDREDSGSIHNILGKRMRPSAKFQNSRYEWNSAQQHMLDMYENLYSRLFGQYKKQTNKTGIMAHL